MDKIKNNKLFFYIILATLSNIIFLGISLPLIPDDYWWHVKIGEWIINNKSLNIPQSLSWLSNYHELNWINHSWLCEILLYFFKIFGDFGAAIYIILFNTLGYFFILYKSNKENLKNNQTVFTIFSIFYFTIFQFLLAPRPYILGFFFLLILIYNLENIKKNDKYNLLVIILCCILWANSHGGSIILSILFSAYYLFFSLINFEYKFIKIKKCSKSQIKKYLITFILTIICSFINPYGIKSILYVLNTEVTTSYIPEWKSIFEFNQPFYYFIIIFIIALTLISIKKNDIQNTLIILGLCFLTCHHMRYIEYLIILLPIYLLPNINFCIAKKRIKNIGMIILSFCTIISIMLLLQNPDILKKPIPDEILEEIKTSEKIFNDYDYGGYLIYNDIPVFWDSRADLYVDSGILMKSFIIQDYNEEDIEEYNINIDDFFNEYQFDYIVLKEDRKLNNYLSKNKNYKIILNIDNCILYKHN